MGISLLILVVIIHLIAAFLITRYYWKPESISDFPSITLLTFFVTFYTFPIFAGCSFLYINKWTIFLSALFALLISLIIRFYYRKEKVLKFSDFLISIKRLSLWEKFLILIILFFLLSAFLIGSQLPARTYDAVGYHTLNPLRWAETHKFIIDAYGYPMPSYYSTCGEVYPNFKSILTFMILDFTGGTKGTALTQFPFLVLLVTCVFSLLRRLKYPVWCALISVLFCILAPEVILQSVEAYADIAFFAGQTAVLFSIILIIQEGYSVKNIILSSISFGILMGTKPTGLLMGGVLILLFLLIIFIKSELPKIQDKIRIVFRSAMIIGIVCLAFSGAWYVHSLVKYKNPVYPWKVVILGHTVFDGPSSQDATKVMTESHQKASGIKAWWKVMNEEQRLPSLSSYMSGLGAYAVILGLPSFLLFILFGINKKSGRINALLLFIFALMIMATPVRTWARFILFELLFFAIAFSWTLLNSSKIPRIILLCMFAFLCSYNVFISIPSILFRTLPASVTAFPFITGHIRGAETSSFPDQFSALDFWREHVAEKGSLLASSNFHPWLARPENKEASMIRIPPFTKNTNFDDWIKILRSTKATHFYTIRNSPDFDISIKHPEIFHLLMHRVDSGAETRHDALLKPEAALFEILPETSEINSVSAPAVIYSKGGDVK